MITWNWDAQRGALLLPLGALYMFLWLLPLVLTLVMIMEKRPDPRYRRTIITMSWMAFLLGATLTAWAMSLPSPTQRKANLRCYTDTLPYFPQPECTDTNIGK